MDRKTMLSFIGKSISVLNNQRQRHVSAIITKYGLGSTGYGFLLSLRNQEGITQRELCSGLSIDDGLGSRTSVSLEKRGYIVRKRSKEDKRSYEVYLTNKAKAIIPELIIGYEQWWEQLCSGVNENDLKILASRLKALAEQASGREIFPGLWKEQP
jgi:DNA-binding MarR family transcriptional regulator